MIEKVFGHKAFRLPVDLSNEIVGSLVMPGVWVAGPLRPSNEGGCALGGGYGD